jgi:MFS family permease
MDRIGTPEARDHLEMVERILAESRQQRLCSGGEYFVVWGIVGAYITVLTSLVHQGNAPVAALWSIPIAIVAGALFSILRGRITRAALGRSSLVQREFFNVLWLTLGLAFVADVAVYRIFFGLAGAAIWSIAEAIVLLYIGMHGNRRAQIAGALVVASLVAANFCAPGIAAYVLAAGMLVGYAGFGIAELLARD